MLAEEEFFTFAVYGGQFVIPKILSHLVSLHFVLYARFSWQQLKVFGSLEDPNKPSYLLSFLPKSRDFNLISRIRDIIRIIFESLIELNHSPCSLLNEELLCQFIRVVACIPDILLVKQPLNDIKGFCIFFIETAHELNLVVEILEEVIPAACFLIDAILSQSDHELATKSFWEVLLI